LFGHKKIFVKKTLPRFIEQSQPTQAALHEA